MSAADRLVAQSLRLGWRVGSRIPEPIADRALGVVASATWRTGGHSVRQLARNLERAAPALDPAGRNALGRAAVASYLRYWAEAFRLPRLGCRQWCRRAARERWWPDARMSTANQRA